MIKYLNENSKKGSSEYSNAAMKFNLQDVELKVGNSITITDKKAFEVEQSVRGGYDGQTRTLFVKATSKKEVLECVDVIKVTRRYDMTADKCPMIINDKCIEEDENYVDPY